MKVQNYNKIFKSLNLSKSKKTVEKVTQSIKDTPQKTKKALVYASLVLAAFGAGRCSRSCTDNVSEQKEIVTHIEHSEKDQYIQKGERTVYTAKDGDNPAKIAKKFNVSTRRFLHENGLKYGDVIYPNQKFLIPESQIVTGVKNREDISKLTGLSEDFITQLETIEGVRDTIYTDINGNKTIGIGHLVTNSEVEKFKKAQPLTQEEIYTLAGQDIHDIELDLKIKLSEDEFESIPAYIKESITDVAFNRGVGVVLNNKKLINALKEKDYPKAVDTYVKDYSVQSNGSPLSLSSHCKRMLYNISTVAKYYEGNIPESIINTAKNVYENGLVCMQNEVKKGQISKKAYANVKEEYQNLAYKWFDGKIGKKPAETISSGSNSTKAAAKEEAKNETAKTQQKETPVTQTSTVPKNKASQKIYIAGGKDTGKTYAEIYQDWENTAKKWKRPVKRPLPEIDANGNIVAAVKVLEPTGKGAFNDKTIIVNAGHGGCMNYLDPKTGKLNTNFDPGTSNAVMSKKNRNVETNQFIGNGGNALEEWHVNMKISDKLAEKIRKEGGKVVYVQGSVYSAQTAIPKLVQKYKANMLVSLHSNSDNKRGILVISNKRGGVDKADETLAKSIKKRMDEHDWFRGIVSQPKRSLAVLSKNDKQTLDIPAVLIETGNLKHPTDIANLNSSQFKDYMVDAIIKGMKDYRPQ